MNKNLKIALLVVNMAIVALASLMVYVSYQTSADQFTSGEHDSISVDVAKVDDIEKLRNFAMSIHNLSESQEEQLSDQNKFLSDIGLLIALGGILNLALIIVVPKLIARPDPNV